MCARKARSWFLPRCLPSTRFWEGVIGPRVELGKVPGNEPHWCKKWHWDSTLGCSGRNANARRVVVTVTVDGSRLKALGAAPNQWCNLHLFHPDDYCASCGPLLARSPARLPRA